MSATSLTADARAKNPVGQKLSTAPSASATLDSCIGTHPASDPAKDVVQFRDCDGSINTWTFVAWKNRNEQGISEEFFVRDGQSCPLVLRPLLPLLPDGHWTASPFPESAPCSIEPFRLIPPPCCASRALGRALVQFANAEESRGCVDFTHKQARFIGFARRVCRITRSVTVPELWELIYGEALAPEPEDAAPLQTCLDAALAIWRQDHARREQQIERTTDEEVQRHLYGKNSQQRVTKDQVTKYIQQERHCLDELYTRPKRKDWGGGWLHTTLADVKLRNAGGIRDKYLHQQWAARHGFDLRAMAREKEVFLQWLKRRYVNRQVNVINAAPGTVRYDLSLSPAQQLAVLASVQYVLHFSTGERIYLMGFEKREKLREEECRQIAEITRSPSNTSQTGSNGPNAQSKWHSDNYDQVWWTEDSKQTQFSLTPTQTRAIRVLDLAHRRKLSTDSWMEQIYRDDNQNMPLTMTPRRIFTVRKNLAVWNKLIRKDGRHYELVPPVLQQQ